MDPKKIRLCTEKATPPDRIVEAAIKAIKENPRNAPIQRAPAGVGHSPHSPLRMAVMTEKRWAPNRTLKVKFLDGVGSVQKKVEDYAHQWEDHCSIQFEFVDPGDDAEIRISFQDSGSWSYLGTDALVIDDNDPTMNYGWLEPNTDDDEYSRVVLHEFGHALGCIHEHQHPHAGIPWDVDKVYQYYELTNGWTRRDTDIQVLDRISADSTNFSDYDSTSIMQYSVPQELTIGNFSVGWNRVLSNTDKVFIGVIYPKDGETVHELKPGRPQTASIGEHGEEDVFQFTVAEGDEGRYRIETRGHTDIVMALYGPDDETRLLAEDDDSGHGHNARITKELAAGKYLVRVRHYRSWGTGTYSIRLNKQ